VPGKFQLRLRTSFRGFQEGQNRKNSFDYPAMGGSWLAGSVQRPHEQRQVVRRGLQEQLLVDILAART
jgi:hypothetical protein